MAKPSESFSCFPRINGPVFMIPYCDSARENLSNAITGAGTFLALAAGNHLAGNEAVCLIGWSSKQLQRFVRSTFGAGTLVASQALGEVFRETRLNQF